MKTGLSPRPLFQTLASVALTLGVMTMLAPTTAAASTSGGATIYNTVKVNYTSGTNTLFATDDIGIIVETLATAPTVSYPSGQIVTAGAAVSYDYTVKSNSNGPDSFATSALANSTATATAATSTSVTASVSLWGGIILGSGAGTITVPSGTTGGLTVDVSTVQIGANQYLVDEIAPGSAASTDASGNLIPEVPATLTLTPITGPAVVAGLGGEQVGEYKVAALTAALTAGTPNNSGIDGLYSTTFNITTGTAPAEEITTVAVTTTVSSPEVLITKGVDSATAKSGATLTYTITVVNTHTSAPASSVTVFDPIPAYTKYVAGSTLLNGKAVALDGATSPLVAGILVDNDIPARAAGAAASGTLPALGTAVITFQVVVD